MTQTSLPIHTATWISFQKLLTWDLHQSPEDWAYAQLEELCKLSDAYQGIYYQIKADKIVALATYACTEKPKDIPVGDGLIGQAASNQQVRILEGLPESYFSTVAAGIQLRPNSLLIIPLVFNQQTQGVLELSFIKTPKELHMLKLLSAPMAAALKNLQQELTLIAHVQELEIRHQKLLEASKEKELLQQLQYKNQQQQASMQYARRIQERMLPHVDELEKAFPELLYYNRCRDIVSGDFHWFLQHKDRIFLACVDCTGHGVPGALMSMLGSLLLDRIISEQGEVQPDRILAQLDAQITSTLRQADESGRDGMDIGLCVFDKHSLQYAGAGRPLWIVRQGQLKEYKGSSYSAGGILANRSKSFECHHIDLLTGDMCYLVSDGFQDQFSEQGKRYSKRRFKQLLTDISPLPTTQQKVLLDEAFHTWKGNTPQIDDILVMGIRV